MQRVTVTNENGAILALLFVEGKVIVKETNGVSVETDDKSHGECDHRFAAQVGDKWFCYGCETYIEYPQENDEGRFAGVSRAQLIAEIMSSLD